MRRGTKVSVYWRGRRTATGKVVEIRHEANGEWIDVLTVGGRLVSTRRSLIKLA